MKILISVIFILFLAVSPAGAFAQTAVDDKNPGTFKHPIIDSKMSKKEAFDGLDPKCPKSIRKRQKLIRLKYYSFDGRVHQGQMVLDKDLVRDVKKVFDVALKEKFPVTGSGAAQSLRPISTPGRACATEGFGSHCGCAPARVRIHSAQRCLAARCGRPRSAHAGRPCAFRGMHSTVVLKHTRNEMLGRIRECHTVLDTALDPLGCELALHPVVQAARPGKLLKSSPKRDAPGVSLWGTCDR